MLDQDERVELGELLQASDFVSLYAPFTDGTRDLVNASTLARTKPSAFLVNTARGGLVNEGALADALRNGRLAGAALDVRASEPPGEDDPLRDLPNVILTPHVAGVTRESIRRASLHVANDVLRLLAGERAVSLHPPRAMPNRRSTCPSGCGAPISFDSGEGRGLRPSQAVCGKSPVRAVPCRARLSMACGALVVNGYRDACHWTGGNSRELIGS